MPDCLKLLLDSWTLLDVLQFGKNQAGTWNTHRTSSERHVSHVSHVFECVRRCFNMFQ